MNISNYLLGLIAIIWLVSMAHMYHRGRLLGYNVGVADGVKHTVGVFEKHGLFDEEICNRILADKEK